MIRKALERADGASPRPRPCSTISDANPLVQDEKNLDQKEEDMMRTRNAPQSVI